MKENIKLREFEKGDEIFIENIIREAWHYDEMCREKTAKKMAKAFLASCLANQTFTQVATRNNQPIGIIMGKDIRKHRCPLRYRWKQFISILSLLCDKEGRKVSSLFKSVHTIDQELLRESKIDYQGELAFFAISQECRGLGIGKELFLRLVDYMKLRNIQYFYLYTDTSCNYQFYEHQGMIRRQEKSHQFIIKKLQATMQFFLYDYDISQK